MSLTPGGTDPELGLPPAVPVGHSSTAGVAVMAHLRRQTAALLEASAGVVAGSDETGPVHATRVATRRLRAGLRIYGDLLEGDVAAALRDELQWYAGVLSPLRDVDVFLAGVAGSTDDHVSEALVPWLRIRRDELTATAVAALGSSRADKLRLDLVALARAPRFVPEAARRAPKVLVPRVLDADRRASERIDALDDTDPAERWHSARITAKRARYAAEVGTPAVGRPAADLAALWARLTDPLGEAQDAVIQRSLVLERVEDAAVPLTAGEAFACGAFVASTRTRESEAHQRASVLWRDSRSEHKALRRAVGKAR
jgi:CHAD domain-containing protein